MDALSVNEGRLRALFEAGLAVTSELSLDALLQRLVEAAAELTGARYAALGVIDASGSELERFITTASTPSLRAAIGDAAARARHPRRADPRGDDRCACTTWATIRARSASRRAIRRCTRFLGVPIMLRGVAYGNLYLTEKQGGEDFTEEDEELVDAARRRRRRSRSRTRGSTRRRRAGRASSSR